MSVTTRRLQRTAVTALAAVAVLAGPLPGSSTALASSPEPGPQPSVLLLNDYGAISSTRFDGVSSTVQLLAQVVDPADRVASVRFISTGENQEDSATSLIGTLTQAPYTLAWTPDGRGDYRLIVQALDADGKVLADDVSHTVVSASASSVHLTSPTSGSALTLGPEHTVQVAGTRSADLPALEVGVLVSGRSGRQVSHSALVAVAAGSGPTEETPDTWNAVVTAPACADPAGCLVAVVAFAGLDSAGEGSASSFGVATEPIARTAVPGISGAAAQSAPYAGTFALAGTAPANSRVTLHLHRQGTPAGDYSLERTVVADAAGAWTRPIAATADYRVYVTSAAYGQDAARSANVSLVVAPTVDGPRTRVVTRDAVTTLTGWAAPGSVVALQVHRAGQPAASYALEQSVRAAPNGRWSLTRTATGDVRVFVTRAGGSSSAVGQRTFLIQAR